MSDRMMGTLVGMTVAVILVGAMLAQGLFNRMLDQEAGRFCRAEAMNPGATLIVRLEKPEPCDPRAMAREAREAVNAAIAAENQNAPD